MIHQLIVPAVWVILFQVISYIIGLQHKSNMKDWYVFINKSALTPPGYVFGVVWPILYCLLAIAGYLLWRYQASFRAKALYIVQMLLNWSWTTLFFGWHFVTLSWFVIAVMIMLVMLLMIETYKKVPLITWLLLPYLGWISFAWYLNFYIWIYN